MNHEINIRVGMAYKLMTIAGVLIMATTSQLFLLPDASLQVIVAAKISLLLGTASFCCGFFQIDQLAIKTRNNAPLQQKNIIMGARQVILTIGQLTYFIFIFIQ